MRWRSVIVQCAIFLCSFTLASSLVDLSPLLAASVRPTESGQAVLADLIRGYLASEKPDQAQTLLEQILQHPEANVQNVHGLLAAGPIYQPQPPGRQRSVPVVVRGRNLTYALSVPVSYQANSDYPLVICLHGAGFTGESYLDRWESRLGEQYILACPTLLEGTWWTRTAEELVLATIGSVRSRYRIDPDRIFLTGMSNGGIGTYLIGAHHASLFAGLAPMASGLDDVLFPFLENLSHTPLYLIHGARDQVMPVELSRTMAQELSRLGIAFVYREHDRVHPMAGGHFFPREELPQLVTWFGSQRREAFPKKITLVRDASHLTSFGWVRMDATDRIAAFTEGLTDTQDEWIRKRIYARLEAEVVAPNRIEVRTQRVRRYSVYLNQTLVDLARPISIVTNGRVSYEGSVAPSVETLLRDARARRDPHRLFPVVLTIAVEGEEG